MNNQSTSPSEKPAGNLAMMQAAFDYHLPDRKKAAVQSFLDRVDKLQSELDELRGSIQ